jgi:hypothetical protein
VRAFGSLVPTQKESYVTRGPRDSFAITILNGVLIRGLSLAHRGAALNERMLAGKAARSRTKASPVLGT